MSDTIDSARRTPLALFEKAALEPGISLYLDLVRLLAALSVFGFHLGYGKFVGHPFEALHVFGSNAVIVFFVLSGFVITHVLSTTERDARSYAVARLSRLYSVVVPALFIVVVLDTLGAKADPGLYQTPTTFDSFVANLFFVNSVWNRYYTFGTMDTYWSLGFEAPYYLIAGLAVFCRGPGRVVWPLMVALFTGPNVVTLLPVWLLGAGVYKLKGRLGRNVVLGLPVFLLPVVAFFVARRIGLFEPITGSIGAHNGSQQLAIIYASALLFGMHLVGARMLAPWLAVMLSPARGAIRWAAGASFTLYLLHVPIAYFIASYDPWQVQDLRSKILFVAGTLAASYSIAEFTERRKALWRRAFSVLLPA